MNAIEIIQNLQALLYVPHSIQVTCRIDNFGRHDKPQLRYELYVSDGSDFHGPCHVSHITLDGAYETMVENILANRIAPETAQQDHTIANEQLAFALCLSPKQDDGEEASEIPDDNIPF